MGSQDYRSLLNDVKGLNVEAYNRFSNYKPEFGYSDMNSVLDKIYSAQKDTGIKSMGGMLDKNKRSARASLAASGINGGAIVNDTMNQVEDNVGGNLADFLSNLAASRENANISLMQDANNNQFRTTSMAANIDQNNIGNLFQKYGLEANITNGLTQAQQYEDSQPTWFDDLLSGITSVAQIALPFVAPGVGSVASAGLGALKGKGGQQQPMNFNTKLPLSTVTVPQKPVWN